MLNSDKEMADFFGVLNQVEILEKELLQISGVKDIEFGLDGFYDNNNQVVFIVHHAVKEERKKELIKRVLEVSSLNGLKQIPNKSIDFGYYIYFVMSCKDTWKPNISKYVNLSVYTSTIFQLRSKQ